MNPRLVWAIAAVWCSGAFAVAQRQTVLPQPEHVQYRTATVPIRGLTIRFASDPASEDRFAADELARGLSERTGMTIAVSDSASGAPRSIVLTRTGALDPLPGPDEKAGPDSREAYRLTIAADGIRITGRSSAAIYYGVQTLLQLVEGTGSSSRFPQVQIDDWPSLPYRATLVDVGSEGPMCTVEQIKKQIDLLARFKGNQYFFYSEANIELDGYPLLNPPARFTKGQVRDIIAYARQRHIDVVPAVELYGHLHDLFRIERYSDLADFPHGGEFNPENPKVKSLLQDWIGQIAALFPSPFVDIGFDETFAIEKAANRAGPGITPVKLFIGQLSTVASVFQDRGKRVMAYGDIMVKFPEIISQLPPGLIALAWYYDPQPDPQYKQWLDPLVANHVPHMVLPGVNSWLEITPDFDMTFANVDTWLAAGRKSGALGMVNTVWTDDGQVLLQMSWPGFAYGAAAAWQSGPMQRSDFFPQYARVVYSGATAADVTQALSELNEAEQKLQAVFGQQTMSKLWADPFAPGVVDQIRTHREDLRQCRLHAENAEESLFRARSKGLWPQDLPSLMVGAQLLDYAGMKYLYAIEIADSWATLPPQPTKQQLADVLSQGVALQTHSRTADLMDTISQLKEPYRRAWLAQYTDYRLPTALGRWDAEYRYWRRAQSRFTRLLARFRDHDRLPTLTELVAETPVHEVREGH
jgi:hexosaminidase